MTQEGAAVEVTAGLSRIPKQDLSGPTSATGSVTADPEVVKNLVWCCRKKEGWEILVYSRGDLWEACFFLWAIHHEHAIGSSFGAVKSRVEERIRILKENEFKSAVWGE